MKKTVFTDEVQIFDAVHDVWQPIINSIIILRGDYHPTAHLMQGNTPNLLMKKAVFAAVVIELEKPFYE